MVERFNKELDEKLKSPKVQEVVDTLLKKRQDYLKSQEKSGEDLRGFAALCLGGFLLLVIVFGLAQSNKNNNNNNNYSYLPTTQ